MMSKLQCSEAIVSQTLDHLRAAGQEENECIVLWLGHHYDNRLAIVEAYRPDQIVRRDRFIIPPDSMASLKAHIRDRRLMIAAQVHSHPFHAFHSEADDEGAIIRHVGALSFVVPFFAKQTDVASFLRDVALYELQDDDRWMKIELQGVDAKCEIRP